MDTICTARLSYITTFCPFSVIICFLWIREQREIISLYNINWLSYITEISPTEAQCKTICTARLLFNITTFCPFSVITCFVWILEQREIISLYNINRLVYIIEISPSETQWTLYVMLDNRSILLRFVLFVYLSVLCESENKRIYFPIQL